MTPLEEHIKKYLEKQIEADWIDLYHFREDVSVHVSGLRKMKRVHDINYHLRTYYGLKVLWYVHPAGTERKDTLLIYFKQTCL